MDLLPYGCLIGKVNLADIYDTGWLIQNLEKRKPTIGSRNLHLMIIVPEGLPGNYQMQKNLNFFLPMKGTLGLWDYNGSV